MVETLEISMLWGVSPMMLDVHGVTGSSPVLSTILNEFRFSNNFVEKRNSLFLKALRNQGFFIFCFRAAVLKLPEKVKLFS